MKKFTIIKQDSAPKMNFIRTTKNVFPLTFCTRQAKERIQNKFRSTECVKRSLLYVNSNVIYATRYYLFGNSSFFVVGPIELKPTQ